MPDPAGIARTIQAKSDLSSKRVGSMALPAANGLDASGADTEPSEVIKFPLHFARLLKINELFWVEDTGTVAADHC